MTESYNTNYLNKLDSFRKYLKEDLTGMSKNCIEVLQGQVEEARSKLTGLKNSQEEDLGEVLIRTLSKDISRYYDNFERYQKTLSEMNTENLSLLRRKIISGDKDFFKETWKEDSDNFFRTRKFISTHLKDLSLVSKINSSLDCLIMGLHRYTVREYER